MDASLEKLSMVGCQDQKGVIKNTVFLEHSVQTAELGIYKGDVLIVKFAILFQLFLSLALCKVMLRLFYQTYSIPRTHTHKVGTRTISLVRR